MMIDLYNEIIKLHDRGEAGILVTVIDKKGHSPAVPGRKMLVTESGQSLGSIGGGELELLVQEKARQLLSQAQHQLEHISLDAESSGNPGGINMLCGGFLSLFYEYLPVRPRVYIFGAGHIGTALAHYLQMLEFPTRVIDPRAELIKTIPHPHKTITAEYEEFIISERPCPLSYIIIASYSHAQDYNILKAIYQANWQPAYIGLVASPKKARIMLDNLKKELSSPLDFSPLYSPAGLDIGGSSPGEIALSILAEIQSLHYQKKAASHLTRC